MDRSALKKYAPQARKDFIAAVTERAAFYGLTRKHIEPVKIEGAVAFIGGKPHERSVAVKRMSLERRIASEGFDQIMEAIAYTWFNRFVAIRYMEIQGFLDHGYRVLSHPQEKFTPEILEHADRVKLPGLHPQKVIDLKLAGDKEGELYRMLLVAQCNALHDAMPFLFERIDDETELLLPENLLHSDSLIRKLVREIPEESWQEIEVIGWIYQFYISEKKDQVIGQVVKSEDIPAATQLFTPNWIVKYLVQNSIGRQWLATYPDSPLRGHMEYYIEPAEQTPEVQAQLKAITPTTLDPEAMTLLDPACGSGHILVEAYDLFKGIYQERGYRARDIPRLILEKNLFGLEIDERAAQLAAFALVMKAVKDDMRMLQRENIDGGIRINIRCIRSSNGIQAEEVYEALTGVDIVDKSGLGPLDVSPFMEEQDAPLLAHLRQEASVSSTALATSRQPVATLSDLRGLLMLFKGGEAKTFGSLIRIPGSLAKKLRNIVEQVERIALGDDINRKPLGERFLPVVEQSWILARKYDAVVANPPYMGGKSMNDVLKAFGQQQYESSKSNLFAMFMERGFELTTSTGYNAMVTMESWMFLASYERLRRKIFASATIVGLVHMPYLGKGGTSMGINFGTAAFILLRQPIDSMRGHYSCVRHYETSSLGTPITFPVRNERLNNISGETLAKIPGMQIAYWAKAQAVTAFAKYEKLGKFVDTAQGMKTLDNERFVREWFEVDYCKFSVSGNSEHRTYKWYPVNHGGGFKKWYGNNESVINWEGEGREIKALAKEKYNSVTRTVTGMGWYLHPGITWSAITTARLSVRAFGPGFLFTNAGMCAFSSDVNSIALACCFINSVVAEHLLTFLSPTMNFGPNQIALLPLARATDLDTAILDNYRTLFEIARADWDAFESSWGFQTSPLFSKSIDCPSVEVSWLEWKAACDAHIERMKQLEEDNNRLYIEMYDLGEELSPCVPKEHITLARPNRARDMQSLLSYSIGCMMGRYSLDEPGLIYANSGNEGFDPTRYRTFHADSDGIIPLTEYEWFSDDAANRFVEFVGVAWPKEGLEENLQFVAESLGQKKGEHARDTIRRYYATGLFKDHLQTYKRRPIYWLFTSGKERAFQCLVYLHRYNEGTLARMRTEYVIPLQGKMNARLEHLKNDIAAATSTAHGNRLERESSTLRRQLDELRRFDEKLNHYAAQRITLDLDDGVKVNYAKLGDLLAEVKAVTGGKKEEE